MFKSYAIKDWMAWCEVFGMPLRLGRYGPSATDADIATLVRAVSNIGSDAAAVVPDSMRIEFQEAGKGQGGEGVFERFCAYIDQQVSKAVLGQTMTTDDGSSQSQAQVHDEVRHDILRADARQLALTINRDLVRPFIDLAFGPPQAYPTVTFPVLEAEDLALLAEALAKLVPLGLSVETSVVRDKFGLPDPEPGAEVLRAPSTPPASPAEIPEDAGQAANRSHAPGCPCCSGQGLGRAANATEGDDTGGDDTGGGDTGGGDVLDEIAATGLDGWERQMAPVIDPIQALLDGCQSYEEALDGDTVDLVCWRHYGRAGDTVAAVLAANPGLAARGPVLPAGVVIVLPGLAPLAASAVTATRLWD